MFVKRMRHNEVFVVNDGDKYVPGTLVREFHGQINNATGIIVAVDDYAITVCWSSYVKSWIDDVAQQIMEEEDAYILKLLATQTSVKP